MKLVLICLFVIFVTHSRSTSFGDVNTFVFGQNKGSVTFSASGTLIREERKVTVTIPVCTDLAFVRVEIDSNFKLPMVTFDWHTRVVTMRSNSQQTLRYSAFSIIAKTVPSDYCLESIDNAAPVNVNSEE